MQCQLPDRPRTRPARRQCYRWRRQTTDASEQNNTGPLGGPVITCRVQIYPVNSCHKILQLTLLARHVLSSQTKFIIPTLAALLHSTNKCMNEKRLFSVPFPRFVVPGTNLTLYLKLKTSTIITKLTFLTV